MSMLNQLQHDHRDLSRLLEGHDYRAASDWLRQASPPNLHDAKRELAQSAVEHWLTEANRACAKGDRGRMNSCLAEAARFRDENNAHQFREAKRALRTITLAFTVAPHWHALLEAAIRQRAHYFPASGEPDERLPTSYRTFANSRLLEKMDLRPEALDRLEHADLSAHQDAVYAAYPEALAAHLPALGTPFTRVAARIAGGRPDLAALDLMELPDANPVVCLERARVAFALGFPATAVLALHDFRQLHGSHVVLKRLHTGVFMAQMAHAAGDLQRAVTLLRALPLDKVGRRPVLLLADLLAQLERADESQEVLRAWCADHPDDEEATARLEDRPPTL